MPYGEEELLDIVDVNDKVIGRVHRAKYYHTVPKPGFVRSVNLFLINSTGKIWIPRRSALQEIKPNALDYSAGGHVSAGETYPQAMCREAKEELGLNIKHGDLINIGKLEPNGTPGRDYYFCAVYVYLSDATPQYLEEEFSDYQWFTPHELMALLDSGEDAKDSLKDSLKLLLSYQANSNNDQKRNE